MPFVQGKTDAQEALKHLRGVIESIRAAQKGNLGFGIANTARDVKASSPAANIYYYDAVTNGRVRIVADENRINAFIRLHFKLSPTKWKIVKSVKASKPRRITDQAMNEVRKKLPQILEETLGAKGLPTGVEFTTALNNIKKMVLEEFKKATLQLAVEKDTKRRFYGAAATPLSEGFIIVEKKAT